jgi:hypothetical protein
LEQTILHRRDKIVSQPLKLEVIFSRNYEVQGISEGTLFRHFKFRLEIIHAVLGALLEHYSKYDEYIFKSILLQKISPKKSFEVEN